MNPIGDFKNKFTRLSGLEAQAVSDTKWSTKTLAIGVAPVSTDYFTSAPNADRTVDNYDAGNQLVTSGKLFMIQSISVNVISTSIADVNAIINQGLIVLTCQNKEIGAFRVRQLNAGGGTFVAGAQVAAASSVGVTNGQPTNEPFLISDLLIETNQSFKATLIMPGGALAYTIIAATTIEVGLHGFEIRPIG